MPLFSTWDSLYPGSSTDTGAPRPSTTELVDNVVDSETRFTEASISSGRLEMALPMPTVRS